ncbi:MAG: MmgE/PrpD family protein [Actinobacteria bacterium]|nr:MAG: MmgE/PrpD family protein [Actinomycetota bacterium]
MTEQGGEPRASSAVDGLPRREFLKRGAIAGGAFGGAWALPALIRDAYGDPIPIPHAARSVEGGLAAFAARWQVAGPAVKLTRFGDFLSDKTFNCRVAGTPRSYVLKLGTVGATLNPGIDPQRHADMVMPEADWLGVLYGDYSGFAALMYGECFPPRSGANSVALLGIVMYAFSFIPAGANPDPKLLVEVLQGLAKNGLPSCKGEPQAFETPQPEQTLASVARPPASAPPVTRLLAEFVAGIRYEDIPKGAVASAKEQLKSIIGVIYAGSRMPPGRKFARAVRAFGDRHEATVLGRGHFRTSARHAALLNSVYAQVLEWEDWTFEAHSGASVVPTALAAGELAGASGKELVAAIVAGNEILARSGDVLTDVIHAGNALATHQIETPLVAGKLLGLGRAQLQDAVGICCTQPQVTSIPAWTADAKGLLTGWPVMSGVEAALYARAGITGRRDILENPVGYCYRVADIPSPTRLAELVDGLGKTWRFDEKYDELFTKRFPTDGFQLTSVQAILDIVNRQAKKVWDGAPRSRLPKLVKRVQVRIPWVMAASATMFSKGSKDIYARIRREPDWTYIALLFDGKYPIAASLVNRRLTFREYSHAAIFNPAVQAMIDKIELVPDITMGVFGAEATVELVDGRSFTSRQSCIANFPVEEKLYIGAGGILSRRQIRAIVRAIDRIETFGNVRDFMRVASGGRRG